MKIKAIQLSMVFCLTSLISCSQDFEKIEHKTDIVKTSAPVQSVNKEPHRYGGWYCPDNLNGFPAVAIEDWKNVPVVNGRMPTVDEVQSEASLILVDMEKYPDAKPLEMTMPKLAYFNNYSTQRKELIILIQALNIDNDSIVGFRYLNGGNGSARLSEVQILPDSEIDKFPSSKFVTIEFDIDAKPDAIWNILTDAKNANSLQPIFDQKNQLKSDWRKSTNINFHYPKTGQSTALYADKLFGNFYVQNDYKNLNYSEKFLITTNEETNHSTLKIVCGPFADDYATQKTIITNWGEKVKVLSEE